VKEFQQRPHSAYPVVDETGKVLGLLRRALAYDYLKHHGFDCQHRVREVALGMPFIVKPDTALPDLVEDLMRTGATKALVLDDDSRMVGIVTVFDLLKGAMPKK